MTDELKKHVQSMTEGQRLYFLLKLLQRDISTSDPEKRDFFKTFTLEFFQDWGEPMTYENCLAMLQMEEDVIKAVNSELVLDLNNQTLVNSVLAIIQNGFRKANVEVTLNSFYGQLLLSYTNKQGENASKTLTLTSNDLQKMSAYARYNVLKQYGDSSVDYRSLLNMPLIDISELYPKKSLANCSWAEISAISKTGQADKYFSLGDTKYVTTLEPYGIIAVRIIGFNHDELLDGSGTAGITFEMDRLLEGKYAMNNTDNNEVNNLMTINLTTLTYIYDNLDEDLRKVIRQVKKLTLKNGTSTELVEWPSILFPLACVEMRGISRAAAFNEGKWYEYYEQIAGGDPNSPALDEACKKTLNPTPSRVTDEYWLRTPDGEGNFVTIYDTGVLSMRNFSDWGKPASTSLGLAIAFCV